MARHIKEHAEISAKAKPSVKVTGGRMDRLAFNWKSREALYRHLATQVSNDVSVLISLQLFLTRMERNKRKTMVKIIRSMIRALNNGASLSDALAPWVPADEAMIISSGEVSGHVSKAFELVIESKQRVDRVNRTLRSSMSAPIIYILAMAGLLWGIGKYVVPTLSQALPPSKAHGLISWLYTGSAFATSYWALLPVIVLAFMIVLITKTLPTWRGPARVVAESYFPWSFYRDIQGYTWLLGFSALLRAGMSDVEILRRQEFMATPWLKERLVIIRRQMVNGTSLSNALYGLKIGGKQAGFPNPEMIDNIDSMASFQDFPERIAKITEQWADEMERTTAAKANSFGFAVELVMYLMMGLLMVSINSLSVQMGSAPGLS